MFFKLRIKMKKTFESLKTSLKRITKRSVTEEEY